MPLPRFQFSLRTLLIAVTILAIGCGYVTWQARKTIAERRALLATIREAGGFIILADEQSVRQPRATVPFIRKLLGDQPVERITILGNPLEDDLPIELTKEKVQEAFPEAAVVIVSPRLLRHN